MPANGAPDRDAQTSDGGKALKWERLHAGCSWHDGGQPGLLILIYAEMPIGAASSRRSRVVRSRRSVLPNHRAAVPVRPVHRMLSKCSAAAAAVCAEFDLGTIVDVTGRARSAARLDAWRRARPARHLLDRPAVTAAAARYFDQAGSSTVKSSARVTSSPGCPANHDTYLFFRLLNDWDDERATQILQPCGEAMTATSRLLILEAVPAQRGAELPTPSAWTCTC